MVAVSAVDTTSYDKMAKVELKEAIKKYLEVPDKGDPKSSSLTETEKEKLEEGRILASEYWFNHQDDPWGVYVLAYGESNLYHFLPRDLSEVIPKLPKKQGNLARRLLLAQKRRDWSELNRTRGIIWQDFCLLVKE